MNLVQKLPIGLGLACLLLMSSCSKEDVQSPEPKMESTNTSFNLKVNGGGGIQNLPYFATTNGPTGIKVYPLDWGRDTQNSSPNFQSYPTGSSSLTHLWGNPSLPWQKPLPSLPFQNIPSILTFTSSASGLSTRSAVTTRLKNLKSGRVYTIDFYLGATSCNMAPSPLVPGYVKLIWLTATVGGSFHFTDSYDLSNIEGKWVKKTLMFTASASYLDLSFMASTLDKDKFGYGNVYVDENSIKEF